MCDVFDALTSRRPYKEAWTVSDGMRAIVEGSGTRFDPVAVSALQALHQRGVVDRIRGEVSDTAD